MSEKSLRLGQRRRRYLARLRGEKKGVSPVVATLILILIAVAAAAALYLWLVVWQGNITGGIGSPHAQAILTLGGSTSAYPFTSAAASWFEQNNSDVTVSDNQGGTTAGLLAVCAGEVDIGVSSSPQTVTTLEASYGCPSQYANSIQITTIAYDAVDVAISSANSTGLQSINYDTLAYIYDESSTTTPTLVPTTINGAEIYDVANGGHLPNLPTSGSNIQSATWNDLPACVPSTNCGPTAAVEAGDTLVDETSHLTAYNNNTSPCTPTLGSSYVITEQLPSIGTYFGVKSGYAGLNPTDSQFPAYAEKAFSFTAPTLAASVACTTAPVLNAYASGQPVISVVGTGQGANVAATWTATVKTTGAGSGSPTLGTPADSMEIPTIGTTACGWTVCATSTGAIVPVERADGSGTTQTFEAKLLGAVSNKAFAASFSALGYTGCGSTNFLSDCGISVATQETGDSALIREVGGNPNAIGYASDGLVRTSGSGVIFIAVDAPGQAGNLTVTSGSTVDSGAVFPTTGSTGTIAAGITDSSTVNQYSGWRPFQFVALKPYTGVAQEFVTFIMDPANNAALASATFEVSVYSV